MLTENQQVFKITTAGTIHVLTNTGYIVGLIASVAAAGLSITIQDKATPAVNKLLNALALTLGTTSDALVKDWTAPQPVRMQGGIDIVNTGTGEAYIWITYLYEPDPQT